MTQLRPRSACWLLNTLCQHTLLLTPFTIHLSNYELWNGEPIPADFLQCCKWRAFQPFRPLITCYTLLSGSYHSQSHAALGPPCCQRWHLCPDPSSCPSGLDPDLPKHRLTDQLWQAPFFQLFSTTLQFKIQALSHPKSHTRILPALSAFASNPSFSGKDSL